MDNSSAGGGSRRDFLVDSAILSTGAALAFAGARRAKAATSPLPHPRPADRREPLASVAAIVTEYRPWSHADVIVGRFIQGYALDLKAHWPLVKARSMYVEQLPRGDISRALGKQYGVRIARTIRDAILDENGKLAVDGVLLVGEHGDYPYNEKKQHLYPRRRFFEETVAAFEEAGAVVPVFNDKHLAPLWSDAKFMYETAKAKGIPFLAGSSLPLTWRRPWLDIPVGTPLEEAVAIGYGSTEAYGFHALEALQCVVERRRGGETGVRSVEALRGAAVWKAMDAGRFSRELIEAALAARAPEFARDYRATNPEPVVFLVEYRDGFKAAVLMGQQPRSFLFATRVRGFEKPVATHFWLQEPAFGHFSYLTHAISRFVLERKAPYPVERTVLTTGVLAAAMDSLFEKGRRIETPDLEIAYAATTPHLGAFNHPDASNDRDGGWIELFDGESLDGWLVHRWKEEPRWEISDGVLRGSGGKGYLSTLETFDDFELFTEMRIFDSAGGSGNSGVYFRCGIHIDQKQEYPPGYEAQCQHGEVKNPTGSIYNLGVKGATAAPGKVKDGEWFSLRIRAEGDRLRTWVNGAPAADCRDPENRYHEGSILLQLHHTTSVVEFREVRIRRITMR